jgi:hypothetical protein
MADDVIPVDLRNFVLQHIDSIAQLEALLLLRANPRENWTLASIAKRLYMGENDVEVALSRVCRAGLVIDSGGTYRYEPQMPASRELVDRLADAYARHLIPITNLIHDKQREIREFANAFRIRRERS